MANSGLRIGLVLSSVPGYSETFFRSKINGLTDLGYTFVLFSRGKKSPGLRCLVVQPYPVFKSYVLRLFSLCIVLPLLFFRAPNRCLNLWKLEKDTGKGMLEIIRSLYINAHILPYKLDWLHFGFSALVIGRENVAKALRAKLAVSFRGFDVNVYPLKHPHCYDQLWKNVDKVHSISQYLISRAQEIGFQSSQGVQIIAPSVNSKLPGKKEFDLKEPLLIVTVARLTWVKGLPYALKAIAILKSMGIKVKYEIVGEGPDREYLLHEIHELQLCNEVSLLGKLPHEQALERIQQSDIYLQPSLNEGFCNAVLEAQAIGCLCIASRVGGLSENIEHGVTGWLVEPRNPVAVVGQIVKLLELPLEDRMRFSSQARQHVMLRFAMRQHVLQWESFYRS